MRTDRLVLISLLLFSSVQIFARIHRDENYVIKKDKSEYYINRTDRYVTTYTICNKTDDVLWMWFKKDTTLSREEEFRKYFLYHERDKSDFSLSQLGFDGNVEDFKSGVFTSFIKRIQPHQHFTVQIIRDYQIQDSVSCLSDFSEKHIALYTEEEILKYRDGINGMNEYIFYKPNSIVLQADDLIQALKE